MKNRYACMTKKNVRNIQWQLNIPHNLLCHITVCPEINLKGEMPSKFLHCFLKHISTAYPKDSRKYESEPTFLGKSSYVVYRARYCFRHVRMVINSCFWARAV